MSNSQKSLIITKSLFKEFTQDPKLAWWHVHSKDDIYKKIMDEKYGHMDGIAIGQAVEDMVKRLYETSTISVVDTEEMRSDWHGTYHRRSIKVLETADHNPEDVVYQPSFMHEDVFVKCDFLVMNEDGQYDLVEVKAKNSIRKNSKAAPLYDDLIADVSVQQWVLKKALGDNFSGRSYIAHLNEEYVKQGPIDPQEIILVEEVTDEMMEDAQVEMILQTMRESLPFDRERFEEKFPYEGGKHLPYFGTKPPKQSLWTIPYLYGKKKANLYENDTIHLNDFNGADIESLYNSKGEPTIASKFVDLWQQGEVVVDKKALSEELSKLQYPLYFYDYETISTPIPIFEGTSPWQQVVVQYSIHRVDADGSVEHFEGILDGSPRPGIDDPNETPDDAGLFAVVDTNKPLLEKMIDDMDGAQEGTFIVWNEGFECGRNEEWAEMYPEYAEALQYINDHTFDLMNIFKYDLYFHRDFEGSCSIKKVLPVLTDVSYEGMAIENGGQAMQYLEMLIKGEIPRKEEREKIIRNLLEYCKKDSWAMVAIWKELKKLI